MELSLSQLGPEELAGLEPDLAVDSTPEWFSVEGSVVIRHIRRRARPEARSVVGALPPRDAGATVGSALADQALLRSSARPLSRPTGDAIRIVDLFAGCGGLSLGVQEACRALGLASDIRLAVDSERAATHVYQRNFPEAFALAEDITQLLGGKVDRRPMPEEKAMARRVGPVDLLVGGPPCQGHSDLNNRTRRADGKNSLFFSMVRAAEVFVPEHVLIENVPGALNDRGSVVQRTIDALERLGYTVTYGIVDLSQLGVPQRRRRLIVLASQRRAVSIDAIMTAYRTPERTVDWAIGDLESFEARGLLDSACNSAPDTRRRIDYLFDNDLYDLPDSQRPPCHALGQHSYSSIYGRLRWDQPAQTITTGFYSMCMGRYVHPAKPRTLTGHEAARLQLFPDFFDFSTVQKRGELATMIGNAVPMKLSYVVSLELFR
jgi:DNA (cytosine-5)-methyltransferase 1